MNSRLSFDFSPRGRGRRLSEDAFARVLVLADLKGDGPRDGLAHARIASVDVNGFESLVRRIRPRLAIAERTLAFESIADFHPDRLYDKLGSFPLPAAASESEDDASTFARLLGGKPAPAAAPTSAPTPAAASSSVLDQMLRELVAPHIVRNGEPIHTQAAAATGDAVRSLLHAPAFQRLESAWRGLRWLVFENPLGHALDVNVLDVSRSELLADLRGCRGELERTQLYRLVMESQKGPDALPYSLVIGDFSFAGTDEDVSLLAGLGAIAAQAGGCFLAAADAPVWGCTDLSRQPERGYWSKPEGELAARLALIRGSAVAPFIGLCMPRVLGRVPYGERSDPTDRFDFTELVSDPAHEDFLWINAAYACAQVILAGVAERGWDDGPGSVLDLGDLPHAMYRAHGGDAVKPCAEVYLDEASAEHVLACGVMPLLSYRNQNALRLARLQSIASPPAPLALRGPIAR